MNEYGVTDRGFIAKPFSVLLEEERALFRNSFGVDIDLDDGTPEGAYVANQAIKKAQLWEMAEGIWLAGDPESASGVYLDRLVWMVDVERTAAAPTTVYACLWGDEGTAVMKGHLARMSGGIQFALSATVTIGRDGLLGFRFAINEVQEGSYSLSIDGTVITITAYADDTAETIQENLFSGIETAFPQVYTATNEGEGGMTIRSIGGITPFHLFCDDPKIEILSLGALGVYSAVANGPTFVAAGKLNEIVSNVSGLVSIINYAEGITGRNAESDAELRIAKNNRQKQASGNEVSIENAVKNVSGVQYAKIYSNRLDEEADGRPPKSYEVVVQGGLDQEIAQAIYDTGPAGVQAFGSTVVAITDPEGFSKDIGFTRPETLFIWIKILFQKNSEDEFPVNGIEQIKEGIVSYMEDNQGVGVDFVYQKLNIPIYKISGIGYAEIRVVATTDLTPPADEDYQAQNIAVSERQIAMIDTTRIIIEEIV